MCAYVDTEHILNASSDLLVEPVPYVLTNIHQPIRGVFSALDNMPHSVLIGVTVRLVIRDVAAGAFIKIYAPDYSVHTPTCYELIPTWSKHFAKLK
jgi:hypothetical protein